MPLNVPYAKLPEDHERDRGLHYRRHWTKAENEKKAVDISHLEEIRKDRQSAYLDVSKE